MMSTSQGENATAAEELQAVVETNSRLVEENVELRAKLQLSEQLRVCVM